MCPSQPNPSVSDSLAFLRASEHLGVLTGSGERIIDANDAFLKMIGFTREEMEAGQIDWRAMTPREYAPLDDQGLEQLRRRGVCVPYEKEFVLRDGTRLPILLGAVRLSADPLVWVRWVVDLRAAKDTAKTEQQARELALQFAAELRGAYRIHTISTRLLGKSSLKEVLIEILDAAIEVTEADLGNIQLVDQGILRIVAERGCPAEFLNFFHEVSHDTTAACGAALSGGSRVMIEDIESDELFRGTPAREVLLRAGIRAVQSTPLVGSSGEIYGMLSTHFRRSHRPTERALRYMDLLATQAGRLLEGLHYAEIERRGEQLRASAGLAASLAHEISNPVQALTNILMLLSRHDAVKAEGQHLVQTAREQLSRVSETVTKMLAAEFESTTHRAAELKHLYKQRRIAEIFMPNLVAKWSKQLRSKGKRRSSTK
jgi:PAS domain S-box-containing protein